MERLSGYRGTPEMKVIVKCRMGPLSTFPEGLQRNLLFAVDLEKGVQPGNLKQVLHSFVYMDKFHLASPLPDRAVTAD